MLTFSSEYADNTDAIIALFRATFSDSEGADEGNLIAGLVTDFLTKTPDDDKYVFSALHDEDLVGCIIFTRMSFDQDDRTVFVLAPVAVHTAHQKQGIGQALLKYGLNALKEQGVDVAVTYGDPNYYTKVGFKQVTEEIVPAPQVLQYPEGWMAQSLTDAPLSPPKGKSRCVDALDKPEFW